MPSYKAPVDDALFLLAHAHQEDAGQSGGAIYAAVRSMGGAGQALIHG